MLEFTFFNPDCRNFTPSTKIDEYAKENGYKVIYTHLQGHYIEKNGNGYKYDHYTIQPTEGGENVTISLALAYSNHEVEK